MTAAYDKKFIDVVILDDRKILTRMSRARCFRLSFVVLLLCFKSAWQLKLQNFTGASEMSINRRSGKRETTRHVQRRFAA